MQRVFLPLLLAGLLIGSWHKGGWHGLLLAGSGVLLWLLLHYTRLILVMRRAARHPKGWTHSALMLNSRLQTGLPLLQVVALTQSLGEPLPADAAEPAADSERWRWRDDGGDSLIAHFTHGRLSQWHLERARPATPAPEAPAETPAL